MRLAFKDRAGGQWKEFIHERARSGSLFATRATLPQQLGQLEHVGNIIIGTVRGNKITPRFSRPF